MFTQKHLLAASALAASAAIFGVGLGLAQSGPAKSEPARFEVGSNPSLTDVQSRLTEQGFSVDEVEYDDGKIEVEGFDASGRCLEIYFSPGSGQELKRERDDDCGSSSRSGDDHWDDDDRWDD